MSNRFLALIFLILNLCFANPIDLMNENIIRLNELHTEQNQKYRQNIRAKIDTLTQKSQSLFLIRQVNELIFNEYKIGAINGK